MALHFPIHPAIRTALESEGRSFAFQPTRTFAIAAIVHQAEGVRREEWTDQVELSPKLFARFPRGIVPSPDDKGLSVETSYKVIDDTQPSRTTQCMMCVLSPGVVPCPTCDGQGIIAVSSEDGTRACIACSGTGKIGCSVCDGERQSVACTIRYVNDRPVKIRQLFVPQVHDTLRPNLSGAIDPDSPWSEELRFDPTPSLVASAYRGATAVRAEDDFHGHYFGVAREACVATKDAAVAGLARFQQRFYAIPILWLIQETGGIGVFDRHAAYFFDASGAVREVLGREPTLATG